MEGIILLVLLLIGGTVALVVWLIARAVGASQSIDELRRRLGSVEMEVGRLKGETARAPAAAPVAPEMPSVAAVATAEAAQRQPAPVLAQPVPHAIPPGKITVSPAPPPIPVAAEEISAPPPLPSIKPEPRPTLQPPRPLVPTFNWEQFMGVKLLAWIGGLVAFLAVAFLVKYSFDKTDFRPKCEWCSVLPPGSVSWWAAS